MKDKIKYVVLQAGIVFVAVVFAFLVGRELEKRQNAPELVQAMATIEELNVQRKELEEQLAQIEKEQEESNKQLEELKELLEQEKKPKELTEREFRVLLDKLWRKDPHLVLVNKEYQLPADYDVTLKRLPDRTNNSADIAYDALMQMLKDGRKEGLSFEVCSSYRSVARQQELIDEDVAALMRRGYSYEEAYEETLRETMPPGHSEHSTGLAFDIVALSYQILDAKQEKTPEIKWLQEHCWDYGFILRYPKDKEDITGIDYESWHYRYVGVETAKIIKEQKITFEEYIREYLQENRDIYE